MSLADQLAATLSRVKAGESLDQIAADRRKGMETAVKYARDAFAEAGLSDEEADARARNLVQSLVGLVP